MTSPQSWIAETVEAVAESRSAPELRRRILMRLQERIGYDSAIFLDHPIHATPPASVNKGEYIRLQGLMAANPGHYRPSMRKGQAVALARGAYLDTSVYSAAERDRMPFYADIVRPQGITSQLHAVLSFHGRQLGAVFLCRHGRIGQFDDRGLQALRTVVPALGVVQAALVTTPAPEAVGAGDDASGRERPVGEPLDRLSPRERTIAMHVARGLRNEDIALVLGTSPNTVRNQLTAMYEKLGASGRAELAAWVARRGVDG